jgi:hypothetical protein
MRYDVGPVEHDGHMIEQRRIAIRFLSPHCRTEEGEGAEAGRPLPDAMVLEAHYRKEVEGHFRPFVEILHRKSRLSRSALWRLVADSLAAVFLDGGLRFGCKAEALAAAKAVLKAEGSALNNRQLHYFEIALCAADDPDRIVMARSFRARGGCCRFYTAAGGPLCTTCVLRDPAERDRRIVDSMCRRLGQPVEGARFTSRIQ